MWTWSVIWVSCVSSACDEPDRLSTIRSPNRSLQVFRGMYTSLLKSWAARLPPIPAEVARLAVTPTTV